MLCQLVKIKQSLFSTDDKHTQRHMLKWVILAHQMYCPIFFLWGRKRNHVCSFVDWLIALFIQYTLSSAIFTKHWARWDIQMGGAHQTEGGTCSYTQADAERWWELIPIKFIWFIWHREEDGSFIKGPEGRFDDRNYWKDNQPI